MSLFLKARAFIERNRAVVTRTLVAIVLAMVIIGWQVDQLKDLLVGSGLLLVLILGFVTELSVMLSNDISARPGVDVASGEDENLLRARFSEHGVHRPDLSAGGVAGKMEIIGHLNPMVMCPAGSEQGQRLREMFDRVFEALWASAEELDTVPRLQEAAPSQAG